MSTQAVAETPTGPNAAPILEVEHIRVQFQVRRGFFNQIVIRAVDDVSLTLHRAETLGLVGESGSGKSTTGRAIVQVEPLVSGEIRLNGRSLAQMDAGELRRQRRRLQMIFQDPYGSLNPRHTVATIVAEPMAIHRIGTSASRKERAAQLLTLVGLDASFATRYPHALSGGQRQRVAIARALSSEPDVIICDEPVSALDVSIQAQIINLLESLQAELGVAFIFIAHDLAVVRHIADRVAVLYLGRVVEEAPADVLYSAPLHPYTQALLSAVPIPNMKLERQRRRIILHGDIPSPANPPSGCRFHTRCWLRERLGNPEICSTVDPSLSPVESEGIPSPGAHTVACHFVDRLKEHAEPVGVPGGPSE